DKINQDFLDPVIISMYINRPRYIHGQAIAFFENCRFEEGDNALNDFAEVERRLLDRGALNKAECITEYPFEAAHLINNDFRIFFQIALQPFFKPSGKASYRQHRISYLMGD